MTATLSPEVTKLSPDLTAFVAEHHRLPVLGDAVKPWEYRGWAMPYVVQIHACGYCGDRWGFWTDCVEAGRVIGPIPEVRFGGPDRSVEAMLRDACELISYDHGWSDFSRLTEWMGWALAVTGEPPALSDKTNEALYRKFNFGPWLAAPYDYLGAWISLHKAKGWNPTAFFPTPHQVCECMVRMVMADDEREGVKGCEASVCDPCVGTGRMLLHAANYSVNLWGMDIDPQVVLCCKINGALYVPWMVRPAPWIAEAVDPPPAPLPVPAEHRPEEGVPFFRVDDCGQGLLF